MNLETDQEFLEGLRKSRETVGELQPVIQRADGEVIDGKHRLKAYPGWRTEVVEADDKKAVLLRIHYNYNRPRDKKETKQLLLTLAQILEKEEVIPKEQIAREIVQQVPFSSSTVYSLLPKKYKEPKKAKRKETYRILYDKEAKIEAKTQKRLESEKPKPQKKEPTYFCPVCGAHLKIVGDLLIQA